MDHITVLITGVGAPGSISTIYALKHNYEGRKVRVIGVDVDKLAVGQKHVDAFHTIPYPHEKTFIPSLLNIAKNEGVDVVLPLVTNELLLLSKAKPVFREEGIEVAVSSPESIEKANNKAELLALSKSLGLPTPTFYIAHTKEELEEAAYSLGYPAKDVVVKPAISRGMRGFRILSEKGENINDFYEKKPNLPKTTLKELLKIFDDELPIPLVVMEYLEGKEYTIDVFRDGSNVIAIPRLREKIRCGISFVAKVERRKDLISASEKLANALGMEYAFGFQFKPSHTSLGLLECNPRVQGTMITAVEAGINMIYLSVKKALNEDYPFPSYEDVDWETRIVRYWGWERV